MGEGEFELLLFFCGSQHFVSLFVCANPNQNFDFLCFFKGRVYGIKATYEKISH